MKLNRNLARVVTMMLKELMAMAGFISKPKKAMTKGMATPPPPMPATVARAIKRAKVKVPAISIQGIGKRGLLSESPPYSSFVSEAFTAIIATTKIV